MVLLPKTIKTKGKYIETINELVEEYNKEKDPDEKTMTFSRFVHKMIKANLERIGKA